MIEAALIKVCPLAEIRSAGSRFGWFAPAVRCSRCATRARGPRYRCQKAPRGANADAVIGRLNPISTRWDAYCVRVRAIGLQDGGLDELTVCVRKLIFASGWSPVQVVARGPGSRLAVSGAPTPEPSVESHMVGATEWSAARSLPRR